MPDTIPIFRSEDIITLSSPVLGWAGLKRRVSVASAHGPRLGTSAQAGVAIVRIRIPTGL